MNFIIIDPLAKTVINLDAPTLNNVLLAAGLTPGEVDHSSIGPILGIVVYEYGLINPKINKYFAIGQQVFNGYAVIYGINMSTGTIIDVPYGIHDVIHNHPTFHWLDGIDEVEKAIAEGKVNRPQTTVNGKVIWSWNIDKDRDPYRIAKTAFNKL